MNKYPRLKRLVRSATEVKDDDSIQEKPFTPPKLCLTCPPEDDKSIQTSHLIDQYDSSGIGEGSCCGDSLSARSSPCPSLSSSLFATSSSTSNSSSITDCSSSALYASTFLTPFTINNLLKLTRQSGSTLGSSKSYDSTGNSPGFAHALSITPPPENSLKVRHEDETRNQQTRTIGSRVKAHWKMLSGFRSFESDRLSSTASTGKPAEGGQLQCDKTPIRDILDQNDTRDERASSALSSKFATSESTYAKVQPAMSVKQWCCELVPAAERRDKTSLKHVKPSDFISSTAVDDIMKRCSTDASSDSGSWNCSLATAGPEENDDKRADVTTTCDSLSSEAVIGEAVDGSYHPSFHRHHLQQCRDESRAPEFAHLEQCTSPIIAEDDLASKTENNWAGCCTTAVNCRSVGEGMSRWEENADTKPSDTRPQEVDRPEESQCENKITEFARDRWGNERPIQVSDMKNHGFANVESIFRVPDTDDDFNRFAHAGSMRDGKNKRQHVWKEQTRKFFTKKPSSGKNRKESSHWGTFLNVVADVLRFKKSHSKDWFQLAGHKGTFREGFRPDSLLKRYNENEARQYISMQCDVIASLIPRFYGSVKDSDDLEFIELEDLLAEFKNPSVMDVKIGVRTYLEEDVNDCKSHIPREDLFNKMTSVDPTEPTADEKQCQAVTKLRYMLWRENLSSTAQLGFRIEAIKKSNDSTLKDFQRCKTIGDVTKHLRYFVNDSLAITDCFLKRLRKIRKILAESLYFNTHELIGSSLLFVYDKSNAGIWLIDFAKTLTLPMGVTISHSDKWTLNSHEDGYLIGLDNVIAILQNLRSRVSIVKESNL